MSLSDDEWQALCARLACHFLVDDIPNRGLAELCETLDSMREFYLERIQPTPLLPTVRRVGVSKGMTMTRPTFELEDDSEE